jgi:hypothetical protein
VSEYEKRKLKGYGWENETQTEGNSVYYLGAYIHTNVSRRVKKGNRNLNRKGSNTKKKKHELRAG